MAATSPCVTKARQRLLALQIRSTHPTHQGMTAGLCLGKLKRDGLQKEEEAGALKALHVCGAAPHFTIERLIASVPIYPKCWPAYWRLAGELRRAGYAVRREVHVENVGDGRTGRIDLVASKDGRVYAIEVDRKRPRKRSLRKLHAYRNELPATVTYTGLSLLRA